MVEGLECRVCLDCGARGIEGTPNVSRVKVVGGDNLLRENVVTDGLNVGPDWRNMCKRATDKVWNAAGKNGTAHCGRTPEFCHKVDSLIPIST